MERTAVYEIEVSGIKAEMVVEMELKEIKLFLRLHVF